MVKEKFVDLCEIKDIVSQHFCGISYILAEKLKF